MYNMVYGEIEYNWLLDSCQLLEYGKFFATRCLAKGMESRVGVRQEGRWTIKLYDATFIEEHHLQKPVN